MKRFTILLLIWFALLPSATLACNPRTYALSYINDINNVLGGEKPKLFVEKGSSDEIIGYYNSNSGIHIYRGDYKGFCEDSLPYLKSIISHEYAHFAYKKLKPFSDLKDEEKFAQAAEHAIGDSVFGTLNVYYDNDLSMKQIDTYNTLYKFLQTKKANMNQE